MLPDQIVYPHFAEREAPWLLHRRLTGRTRIADLRRGPLAPLLARPGVREIVANCGDGLIEPHQLLPLADPLYAFGRERELMIDRPTETAFDLAAVADWRMFTLSFAGWAEQHRDYNWRYLQLSRAGGNLVLQLNFPEPYRAAFERTFAAGDRRCLEYYGHPVRRDGPITMAWARLDLDTWGEDVLIEELQTDWLRAMRSSRRGLTAQGSKQVRARRAAFIEATNRCFARDWSRVLMLAVLIFASRELGARRVWMHQPRTGAKLKNIRGIEPPRSLYTDLPRRFGFQRTDRAPEFLYKTRSQVLARLRRAGQPLFWRLDLDASAV